MSALRSTLKTYCGETGATGTHSMSVFSENNGTSAVVLVDSSRITAFVGVALTTLYLSSVLSFMTILK